MQCRATTAGHDVNHGLDGRVGQQAQNPHPLGHWSNATTLRSLDLQMTEDDMMRADPRSRRRRRSRRDHKRRVVVVVVVVGGVVVVS